ncbi:hypothetical protein ACF0H5_011005 [Mactra antiquata]
MINKSLLLGVVITILHTVQCEHILYLNGWAGGMTGDVFIHADHMVHGWEVHLYFEYEYNILETGMGKVTRINAHEWLIQNTPYNGVINKGITYTVFFVARGGHWDESATKEHTGTYTVKVFPNGHNTTQTNAPTSSQATTSVPMVTSTELRTLTNTPIYTTQVTYSTQTTSTGLVFTATSPKIKRNIHKHNFRIFQRN